VGAAARMVQQWADSVKALFCSLHGHTVKALAAFSFAMCRCGHCHSGQLAASVVSAARPASSRRRWERLLAGGSWDGRAALAELAGGVFRHWVGRRVLLVLDETPGRGDLRSMRLGVAYRKRLLTVDARCYPKHRPPLFMPRLICQMLKRVAAALPAGVAVTFLCDRGLAWPSVMDCVRELGWGHVLRLQKGTKVKLPDGRTVSAGDLVRRRGRRWHGRATIFKKAGWRDAHVSVVWDKRCKEPWILAARPDGLRGLHAAAAYAKRGWCEQSFRDEKSGGFRWDQSHVTDPDRLAKLIVVMTLANLLSLSTGTWLLKSGRRRALDPHAFRRLSLFQLGIRWLRHLLTLAEENRTLPPYLPYLHPS
jgi:Transposase DDE domain